PERARRLRGHCRLQREPRPRGTPTALEPRPLPPRGLPHPTPYPIQVNTAGHLVSHSIAQGAPAETPPCRAEHTFRPLAGDARTIPHERGETCPVACYAGAVGRIPSAWRRLPPVEIEVTAKRYNIGFVVNDLASDYQRRIFEGVLDAAAAHGVGVVCLVGGAIGAPGAEAHQAELYNCVRAARLDGVVVVTGALSGVV